MSDHDLTLPGDIPGLLRRGSPVVLFDSCLERRTGVVIDIPAGPEIGVHAADGCDISEVDEFKHDEAALDLTDATGRAHAAWWLAESMGGLPAGHRMHNQTMTARATPSHYWLSSKTRWADLLAHLDPNDPRTLPDGSRWVDAESLRLVCLYVAERTP